MDSKALEEHFSCITSEEVYLWDVTVYELSRSGCQRVCIILVQWCESIAKIRKQESAIWISIIAAHKGIHIVFVTVQVERLKRILKLWGCEPSLRFQVDHLIGILQVEVCMLGQTDDSVFSFPFMLNHVLENSYQLIFVIVVERTSSRQEVPYCWHSTEILSVHPMWIRIMCCEPSRVVETVVHWICILHAVSFLCRSLYQRSRDFIFVRVLWMELFVLVAEICSSHWRGWRASKRRLVSVLGCLSSGRRLEWGSSVRLLCWLESFTTNWSWLGIWWRSILESDRLFVRWS